MSYKLLRGDQVAELLNISRSAAYNLMRRGVIPSIRVGHSIRVRPEDLRSFIERNLVLGDGQLDDPNHIVLDIQETIDRVEINE